MEIIAQTKLENPPLSNSLFTVFSNVPALTVENKLAGMELLQKTLDLKELMNNFSALVAKFVRPFNIRFQSAHGFFSLTNEGKYPYYKSYNLSLSSAESRLGSITYQSDRQISVNEDKLLTELHHLLITNLKHALKFSELNAMVFKDHLTNIGNRAYYEESLHRAIEQCSRNQQNLSLIILDVNNFKIINDTLGHLTGDKVLQTFSGILIKSIRSSDMAFRLGGDEFAIILQPGGQKSVDIVSQRIRTEIESDAFLSGLDFSSSLGFSHWQIGVNASELFSEADQLLYLNKASHKGDR
ncbi:MAG: GGDEF domain-containing protein, partial [Psychromonas sp.]|nr:GGDEF domain-containing protein [Psychromonas sp.]